MRERGTQAQGGKCNFKCALFERDTGLNVFEIREQQGEIKVVKMLPHSSSVLSTCSGDGERESKEERHTNTNCGEKDRRRMKGGRKNGETEQRNNKREKEREICNV